MPANPGTSGGAPAPSDGASTPKASATPAGTGAGSTATESGSKAGGVTLAQLSTADPDCALDSNGKPWRWNAGHLEAGPATVSGAKAISCSSTHTCVIASDATVQCWGDNTYGALGDGKQTSESPDAVVVAKDVKGASEVVVDISRTCARTQDGNVYCWGDREFAKAGDGTLIDGHKGREKPLPGKPVLGLTGATSIGVSTIHACAATGDGSVMCWGQCRSGACGQPPKPPWLPRAMKAAKVSGVATLSSGENATCAVDKQGGVSCWGTSQYGVLGDSVTDNKPHDAPSKIALPAPATQVAVGVGNHACARLANGAVHCWGHNEHGQLGNGTTTDSKAPVQVKGVEGATSVATGDGTSCAVANGKLWCWGQKRSMKPGGKQLEDAPSPVEIKTQ
jgi:alpha-tubulin suppressor-like RCC1 family protein